MLGWNGRYVRCLLDRAPAWVNCFPAASPNNSVLDDLSNMIVDAMAANSNEPQASHPNWRDQLMASLKSGQWFATVLSAVLAGLFLSALGYVSFAHRDSVILNPVDYTSRPIPTSSDSGTEPPLDPVTATVPTVRNSGRLFMVAPCDDVAKTTTRFTHDSYGQQTSTETCRALLEDAIVGLGGKVVDRDRLDTILQEMSFQQASGLVDEQTAARIGKMLGAKYVIIGTIINADTEKQSFSGYGIKTNTLRYSVTIRVRILEIQSSLIAYSGSVSGSASEQTSRYGGSEGKNGFYLALQDAISHLQAKEQLRNIVR